MAQYLYSSYSQRVSQTDTPTTGMAVQHFNALLKCLCVTIYAEEPSQKTLCLCAVLFSTKYILSTNIFNALCNGRTGLETIFYFFSTLTKVIHAETLCPFYFTKRTFLPHRTPPLSRRLRLLRDLILLCAGGTKYFLSPSQLQLKCAHFQCQF